MLAPDLFFDVYDPSQFNLEGKTGRSDLIIKSPELSWKDVPSVGHHKTCKVLGLNAERTHVTVSFHQKGMELMKLVPLANVTIYWVVNS